MTATVIDLTSRLARAQAAATCDACAMDTKVGLCYPHRLEALATRLRGDLEHHDGELLTATDDLAVIVRNALDVLDGITGECLRADGMKELSR